MKAIVLRETDWRESDRILTLLASDGTLFSARAPGVRKTTSPLKSACQILTFSEFTVSENRGYCIVKEAVPIELFSPLRGNVELISLAMYFSQISEVVSQMDAPSAELPKVLYSALRALGKGRAPLTVKATFELRIAALGGYTPDLESCPVCGSSTPDRFCVTDGCVCCARCRGKSGGLSLPISQGTLDAMRYCLAAPAETLFSFSVGKETAEQFSGITETYLLTRFERGFSALDFYRTLILT